MTISWSHSVLESFETCPWRHYLTKVSKEVVDPPGPAMARGRAVHKSMENRIKNGVVLPDNLQQHEPIVQRLITLAADGGTIEVETQMALTQSYATTSWFAKDVWVRAITDVSVFKKAKAFVGDYKTGKRKSDSAQLKLSACVLFAQKPWLDEIRNSFIWLDEPDPKLRLTAETYHRADAPNLWREFLPRVARLENAHAQNAWPKRPSGLCRAHCPVPRSRCEHSGA